MNLMRGTAGWLVLLCVVLWGLVAAGAALAQTTTRVSVASDGTQWNEITYTNYCDSSISADGRYVAFEGIADNLVAGDTNRARDVFVHDRVTGQTTRVSVASDGTQGNNGSMEPSISADGRYVAFVSYASNLVAGDTNGNGDIFVHDRVTGQTTRVSVDSTGTQGNEWCHFPSISADGRHVAFRGKASNLAPGDTNNTWDIFVHDRVTAQTTLVSVASDGTQGNGASGEPSISADGRYVAFTSSASNLAPGDTNGWTDVFVHDRVTGQTTRVNVSSTGTQGNNSGMDPSISADGRYVAFRSGADNLVPGDTNRELDVFVHDRVTGQMTRVSVASDGTQGNEGSWEPSISADGRYVAFASYARTLVAGDTNHDGDVFVHDRVTGQTTRVSVASEGTQGNEGSGKPSISADGRYVAFAGFSNNLVPGDTNNAQDIFVHDRQGVPPPPSMLAATRPVRGAVNVPRRDPIVVTFAQRVVMGSADVRFSVIPGGAAVGSAEVGTPVTGKIDWLRAFTTLRFTPDSPLPALSPVTVNLAAGIRRKDGTIINYAENFTFTTGSEPVVTAWGPKGDRVGAGAAIRVTFDQAMHRISVQRNLSSQPRISGTYSWIGRSLTFTPAAPLTPGTKYRVVVGRKSRSAAGAEMGRSWVWEFTTSGAVPSSNAVSVVAAATSNGAAVTVNLSSAANVQVQVLNIAGRPVAVLPEQSMPQGLSTLNWNGMTTLGTKAPAGTYLVRVIARNAEGAQTQGLTTLSLGR